MGDPVFFTFDDQTIQTRRKGGSADGLSVVQSTVWVQRVLSPAEIRKLLVSNTITSWVAADGAVGSTGAADIRAVRGQIRDFVNNCNLYPQTGQ